MFHVKAYGFFHVSNGRNDTFITCLIFLHCSFKRQEIIEKNCFQVKNCPTVLHFAEFRFLLVKYVTYGPHKPHVKTFQSYHMHNTLYTLLTAYLSRSSGIFTLGKVVRVIKLTHYRPVVPYGTSQIYIFYSMIYAFDNIFFLIFWQIQTYTIRKKNPPDNKIKCISCHNRSRSVVSEFLKWLFLASK